MAPSEAFSNNSRPFLALRATLHKGKIQETLGRPIRHAPPGTRRIKRVTATVIEQLVADYHSGLGVYDLARKHGLHRYTVAQHLSAAGVVMRRTITTEERDTARELYLSGAPYAEIARRLKRDPATIRRMIQSLPVKPAPSAEVQEAGESATGYAI